MAGLRLSYVRPAAWVIVHRELPTAASLGSQEDRSSDEGKFSNSEGGNPSVSANRQMLRRAMFRCPRSTPPR